jgi:hypothetical protein
MKIPIMNNPSNIYKPLLFGIIAILVWVPVLGQQSPLQDHRIMAIQKAYSQGEMGLDEAVLDQFKFLYNTNKAEKVVKCATPVFMFYEANKDQLSSETKAKIESLRSQVQRSKSIQSTESYHSPGGKFEIIYKTSGPDSVSVADVDGNGVPDYVDIVAESADSSYRHEIFNIGFTDPIPDGSRYKIYIEDTGGAYGYTETVLSGTNSPSTEIYIENDFDGFPVNSHPEGDQVGAIYATIAHEFKHAVQYRQNKWRSPSGDFDWIEMDATLMEEVVYDDVNDYYNYIKNGFNSPAPYSESIFFAPHRGTPGAYWHVSWMIYYSERYGNDVWRDVWGLIEEENNLAIDDALRRVLPNYSETFAASFTRNHLWHFASGDRAGNDDYGFGEKEFYPNANLEKIYNSNPDKDTVQSISRLAARYFEVNPDAGETGFIDVAVDMDSTQIGIGLLFFKKDGTMQELISTGRNKPQVYVPTDQKWNEIDKLGVVLANYSNSQSTKELVLSIGSSDQKVDIRDPDFVDLPEEIKVYQNYPNPFNPVTNINFDLPRRAEVKLEVFDIMGRKIQTLREGNLRIGSYSVPFDGSGLSSGTYLYRLQINDISITKKMLLVK